MTAVQSAHRISDEAEALAVAAELAAQFAEEAAGRDAGRQLPYEQVGALAASGLLALGVPREHGGIDARTETLAEVFRLLAEGDPSIAQIPHSHYTFLEVLRHQGTPAQQEFFYSEVLAGRRFANAQSERGTKTIDIDATTLTEQGGDFVVDGRKFYSTGALFADWIAVRATLPGTTTPTGTPAKAVAYLPRTAAGLSIVDDWDGMGQKTTASGTVTLDAVRVPAIPRRTVLPHLRRTHHVRVAGPDPSCRHRRRDRRSSPERGRALRASGKALFRGGRHRRRRRSPADPIGR